MEKIQIGDAILIKISGGPVVAVAQAHKVRFFCDLDAKTVDALRASFNDRIQAGDAFWKEKQKAKYATFIYLIG